MSDEAQARVPLTNEQREAIHAVVARNGGYRIGLLDEMFSALLATDAHTWSVPPMLEGAWRVTMGNGRQFLVHSSAKVRIALSCGYTVEQIHPEAEAASGQSNQCKNTGNQA
ncbi:hypothetical protein SB778_03880 [Paraburkholderia sp. SIMBA_050]